LISLQNEIFLLRRHGFWHNLLGYACKRKFAVLQLSFSISCDDENKVEEVQRKTTFTKQKSKAGMAC
jgi:hypothetical protein